MIGTALTGAAVLAAMALVNNALARRTEQAHPPQGQFLTVDGVRLHYTDQGQGSPVVLIHGNVVRGDDWEISGVAPLLRRGHRVIIFDRPGFGHSERPHGRMWTAQEQADVLRAALRHLRVERPVIVGHSWGTLGALALAERHPAEIGGLVLLSGYYFWTVRPDVLPPILGALPVLGDVLSHTIAPLAGWLQMPLLQWAMFSPLRVPERFRRRYSTAMALRPSQLRATSMDGALMIPGAVALRDRYQTLTMPVFIMAGAGDRVVFKRMAERLAAAVPGSTLRIVAGVGHMLHHAVPDQVVEAIETVAGAVRIGREMPLASTVPA